MWERLPLLAVLAAGIIAEPATPAATAPRPNIVIIVLDDQRADTLNATVMPRVAEMLTDTSRTTTFANAFVPNPLCCPSRSSTLTGAYSHTTGIYDNTPPSGGFASFDDSVTIATALTPTYRTSFVGKYLNGYPQGEGTYVPPGWDRWFAIASGSYYDYRPVVDGRLGRRYGDRPRDYSGRVLTDRAIRDVDAAVADGAPFFLYFAPAAAHGARPGTSLDGPESNTPVPAPRHVDRFASVAPHRPPTFGRLDDVRDMPAYIQERPWTGERRRDIDLFRQRQLETIASADAEIHRLLAHLPPDTLVLFLSDNGYHWGEHRWTSKTVPYEESIRVPMWVRWPDGTDLSGVDPSRLALNVDVVPTILGFAGYPPDRPTASAGGGEPVPPEGVSLFDGAPRADFVLEHWQGDAKIPGYCGVRTADGWMYARYWDRESADDGFVDLYDVGADPLQRTNLSDDPAYDTAERSLRQRAKVLCEPVPPHYSWNG